MRLSEAIRLGSLLVENPEPGRTDRCAVGMGLKAIGRCASYPSACAPVDAHEADRENYAAIVQQWPWLAAVKNIRCPKCYHQMPSLETLGFIRQTEVLFHVFDLHVMLDYTMTIEQLADFIASIEPQEEAATGEDWGDVDDSLLRRRGQDTSAPRIVEEELELATPSLRTYVKKLEEKYVRV